MPPDSEVHIHDREFLIAVDRLIRDRLTKIGAFVQRTVIEMMRLPKSGRFYKSGKTTRHRASAPGEAPAARTGRLRQSIAAQSPAKSIEKIEGGYTLTLGAGVRDYPVFLEFGTSKMAPRPVWRPALAILRQRIGEFLKPEA